MNATDLIRSVLDLIDSVVTITAGQTIDIRASSAFGEHSIGPRMSLVALPIAV